MFYNYLIATQLIFDDVHVVLTTPAASVLKISRHQSRFVLMNECDVVYFLNYILLLTFLQCSYTHFSVRTQYRNYFSKIRKGL